MCKNAFIRGVKFSLISHLPCFGGRGKEKLSPVDICEEAPSFGVSSIIVEAHWLNEHSPEEVQEH